MREGEQSVVRLGRERFDAVVATLCESFRDYPTMRYILKDAGPDYDAHLVSLVAYFTDSRVSRGWPVLGIVLDGEIVAAANVSPARSDPEPASLQERFRRLREELGPPALDRLARFARATEPFRPAEPHYYLGMVGVSPRCQGRGLARVMLDAVHDLSDRDPASCGVVLTTETPKNVTLYEHFGYRVLGRARVDDLETWLMFRPVSGGTRR